MCATLGWWLLTCCCDIPADGDGAKAPPPGPFRVRLPLTYCCSEVGRSSGLGLPETAWTVPSEVLVKNLDLELAELARVGTDKAVSVASPTKF